MLVDTEMHASDAKATPFQPALLSLAEAAKLLSVSQSWLTRSDAPRLALNGRSPTGRKLIRFDREELLAWARKHVLGGTR